VVGDASSPEVDVARRFATRAPDLQPGEASVHGWSIVVMDRSGSPSDHIRSFQLPQSSLRPAWMSASPFRVSADWVARMLAIARLAELFRQACDRPPDSGVG